MQCPECRVENLVDALFCEECGAAFESTCPECGSGNRSRAKFCRKCRAALTARPVAAPAPPAPAPTHLAERIRQSKQAPTGERKQVTVLFADVKGSMELAEQIGPGSVVGHHAALLLDSRPRSVQRFEGFVDKFTGDGIMALFGAPIAHEDHAQRACCAALAARDAVARYATEVKRRARARLFDAARPATRARSWSARIGDDLRMDYTAQGHTVGLAQRMEALASPGHLLSVGGDGRAGRGLLRARGSRRVPGQGPQRPGARPPPARARPRAYPLRRVARARPHALRRPRRRPADARGGARRGTGRRRPGRRCRGGGRHRQEPALSRACASVVAAAASPSTSGTRSRTGSTFPISRCSKSSGSTTASPSRMTTESCARRSPGGCCSSTRASVRSCRCSSSSLGCPIRRGRCRRWIRTRSSVRSSRCSAARSKTRRRAHGTWWS